MVSSRMTLDGRVLSSVRRTRRARGQGMWFEMRKEDLGFLDRAPVVHVAEAEVPAARAVVFAALTEPRCWKHWFPNLREASYTSPPPHGVGTIREANFSGTHWIEELIAWASPSVGRGRSLGPRYRSRRRRSSRSS